MPFIRYFIILVVISILPVSNIFGQAEFFPFLAEIQASQVNIRSGENENFEKIGKLIKGDQVVVVAKRYHWYKIQLPITAISYISEKYVQLIDDKNAVVMASKVNVRCGPNINNTVLGQVEKGVKLTILGKENNFYKIIPVSNTYGWLDEQYVVFKSNDILSYKSLNSILAAESSFVQSGSFK